MPRGSKSLGRAGTTSAMRDGVEDDLVRVLVVELDEGHAGVVAVGLLLGEQPVEAGDDLLGHGRHGAGPVEQDVDVDGGGGRVHARLLQVLGEVSSSRQFRLRPKGCRQHDRGVLQGSVVAHAARKPRCLEGTTFVSRSAVRLRIVGTTMDARHRV